MENLILPATNTIEQNVLAIIEFVKQVEREHGLSEEQIIHKYTCGYCGFLVDVVIKTLDKLFGTIKEIKKCTRNINYNDELCYHCYLCLKTAKGKSFYYDILGKKTKKQMLSFVNGDFWYREDEKNWVKDFEYSREYSFKKYVAEACEQHIQAEGVTVQ